MMIFDIAITMIIFMIVLMVLCGVFSLCESKTLAMFQLSVGPGLFIFGILTPITDGIKLFIKFMCFVISFDLLFFIISIYVTICCMYFVWLFFPIGYLMMFDMNFSIIVFLCIHITSNVFSILLVGCFLFTSCFMYLAAMRALFFSILSEASFSISLYTMFMIDYFSFFSLKELGMNQIFMNNIFLVGLMFLMLFTLVCMLDGLKMPFDYLECESELVAGMVTEFSGFFFMMYSLLEINHMLLSSMLISVTIFGGMLMTLKSICMIFFFFLLPRALGCSIKITTAQTFSLVFIFSINFLFFIWIAITKMLTIMN